MNIKLNYEEKGKGFPLILLHGNGENTNYFKNQINFFSEQYRVIAIDTRGHGKSPRGKEPFTIRQFAEDLHDFMDDKGIRKAHLLGFSDGGNIVLAFALKYQERIEKLIVSGENLNTDGVKSSFQLPVTVTYRILSLFSGKEGSIKKKQELLGLMVNEPNIEPESLHKVTVPALVIAGTNDIIKKEHTELIAASLPNSKLVFIKGGHSLPKNKSEEFNKIVDQFLEEKKEY